MAYCAAFTIRMVCASAQMVAISSSPTPEPPYLHIYAQDPDQWRGVRHPLATVRIMDETVFQMGRCNPENGGPKGLDIDACSNILVVTSECQPLAFFDVPLLLQHAFAGGSEREKKILSISHELSLIQEIRMMAETWPGN